VSNEKPTAIGTTAAPLPPKYETAAKATAHIKNANAIKRKKVLRLLELCSARKLLIDS
jgi:hypothetical protein